MIISQVTPEVVWPIRHQVMYPDFNFEDIKLASDISGIHLALSEEQQVISVVSLFIEGQKLQFRKFATLGAYQQKGYGTLLLKYVIDFAKIRGLNSVWCNARTSASGFYQRFGFKETAATFFKDGHHFVIMELIL